MKVSHYIKNSFVVVALVLLLSMLPVSARALSVNFNLSFTADEVINMWQATSLSGTTLLDLSSFDDGNWNNREVASTYNVSVTNFDSFSLIWEIRSDNDASFLAEIMDTGFGDPFVLTAWSVSTDNTSWNPATPIGPNDGTSYPFIVDGISESTQWISTDSQPENFFARIEFLNGLGESDSLREEFDVTPVPEPGTILLVGAGLVGLALCSRKMKK